MDIVIPEIDEPLDADSETKVAYMIRNLVCPGHAVASAVVKLDENGDKSFPACNGLAEPLQNNSWFRNLLRRHLTGSPAKFKVWVCSNKKRPGFHRDVVREDVCLGVYFGSMKVNGIGPGMVVNFAIDCDEPNPEKAKRLMDATRDSFPTGALVFFVKPNSPKWHAHGKLTAPLYAETVKYGLRAMIPDWIAVKTKTKDSPPDEMSIEIFPKFDENNPPELGNMIRLPWNRKTPYEPPITSSSQKKNSFCRLSIFHEKSTALTPVSPVTTAIVRLMPSAAR